MTQYQSHEDSKETFGSGATLKKAAGLAAGAWMLKRYPYAALWGVFAVGLVAGLAMTRSGRTIFRETFASARPDLH